MIIDGDQKAADDVLKLLTEAGTNVAGEVLFFNGGNLFNTKLSAEEAASVDAWIDGIIANLN